MSRDVIARIDLSALSHNFSYIKRLLTGRGQPSAIMAMVKSNAYGHDLLRIAGALSQADGFGVSSLEEAVTLREAGIKAPITVMIGFHNDRECSDFMRHGIQAVVHHVDQVGILEKQASKPGNLPLAVWLKIDTGMRRLGFLESEVEPIYRRLSQCSSVKQPIGLMTHLADADNPNFSFTQQQISRFMDLTRSFKAPRSIANSGGICFHPDSCLEWVRPGIMLYGVSPSGEPDKNLRPVMTLSSKLIAIKHCRPGDYIGYGCTWRSPEEMPVGIVSIGYGDGYPRHAVSGTPTQVRDKICPLVGRVSMDMLAIDLRPQPAAAVQDTVFLWGEGVPIETVAACAGTIPYELLCQLSARVQMVINNE